MSVTLYRVVGQSEMGKIDGLGRKAFPERYSIQTSFFSLCTEQAAVEMAERRLEEEMPGYVFYVTKYELPTAYLAAVRGNVFEIPAAALERMNKDIIGKIRVLHTVSWPAA